MSIASTATPYRLFERMAFAESARRGGCGEACVNAWMLTYQIRDLAWFAFHSDDLLELGPDLYTVGALAEKAGIWAAKLHGQSGDLLP